MTDEHPIDVIATRLLEVDGKPGFEIRIGRPVRAPEGDCWFCPYEVLGPQTQYRSRFGGEDSMQALVHALYAAAVNVEISTENQEGRLSWFGDKTNFGIPSPPVLVAPEEG